MRKWFEFLLFFVYRHHLNTTYCQLKESFPKNDTKRNRARFVLLSASARDIFYFSSVFGNLDSQS